MKFGLLILSDIHFTLSDNPVLEKVESLIKLVSNEMKIVENLFLCVVGDSANTGKLDEYIIATDFLDALINGFKTEDINAEILLVPGNHDCNFEGAQAVRNTVLDKVKENEEINEEYLENILKVQEEYRYFENGYLRKYHKNTVVNHPIFKKVDFEIDSKVISFNLLNTSWMSIKHENPGSMIFPIEQFTDSLPRNEAALNITLVHHHMRWLHPNNSRVVEPFLAQLSDILISGHEHSPTDYTKISSENSLYYLECGALQEGGSPNNSTFQTIIIDLEKNLNIRKRFEWDYEINQYYTVDDSKWEDLTRITSSNTGTKLKIKDTFLERLADPGAPFQHPRKQSLQLNDIYVPHDLKEILVTDKGNLDEYTDTKKLFKEEKNSNLIFTGNEKSGKTILLRKLFIELYTDGYYPILLDGSNFKKTNIDDIRKQIDKTILSQYTGKHTLDQFSQLPLEKKIFLIDDFQKSPLNIQGKRIILDNFQLESSRMFITTSDLHGIRDLLVGSNTDGTKLFRKFEVTEFGHLKRAELIDRWLLLGQEETIDEKSLISKKDWTENQLRSLVSKGHVPSYPFFLLTILQALESSSPHQMKDSTKGHYYDVLINEALTTLQMNNREIDIMKNYISHLSYTFFLKKDVKAITNLEFKDFHKFFESKYEESINFENYRDKLLRSALIFKEFDVYKFKYPYVYYYFVAKYLADNIERSHTREEIKNHIQSMIKNLYNDEYANILMFLIHLSKNEYILNEVLESAKNSFDDMQEISLETEVTALNDLIKSLPDLIIEERTDVKQNRTEMHEQHDKVERSRKMIEIDEEAANDNFEAIDQLNAFNQSFKTIELIGQLLQSYPGYIEGADKRRLCHEAINSGLRLLNVFLQQFVTDKDYILEETTLFLKSSNLKSDDDRSTREYAKKFLFDFCSWVTFTTIQGISKSLGNKDIKEIIDKVIEENPNVARKLISISTSLDHTYSIPHQDISSLYKELEYNKLPQSILKRMVVQHLHLFEVNFDEKQRICKAVEINYKQQVFLDSNSKVKALKH